MRRILPQTEAFVAYHQEREQRNRAILASRAAFWTVERLVAGETGDFLLGQLVDASRSTRPERKRIAKPLPTVAAARQASARMGIVHELSAFERFLRASVVDAAQFSGHFRSADLFRHQHDDFETTFKRCGGCHDVAWKFVNSYSFTDRADGLSHALNLSLAPADALLPVLNYFWHARNRIAHDDGYCGERLAEYVGTAEFKAAWATWNNSYSKRAAPELPTPNPDERLQFLHEHAVLCGAVCHRLARALTTGLVEAMGERAMLLMSAYYAYHAPAHPYRAKAHDRPDQAIAHFFFHRYRCEITTQQNMISLLRTHALWDLARAGFRRMYPSGTR